MEYASLILGIILLVISANYFVKYAVSLAKNLRLQTMAFGAVIVALGTSLPELSVTVGATIDHAPDIIVGTILGSNIANVGLILGVALLLGKIRPDSRRLRGKNNLLLLLSFIFICLLQLKLLYWPIGLALLALAAMLVFDMTKNHEKSSRALQFKLRDVVLGWTILIASLAGVIIGAQVTVDSSLAIAKTLDLSAGIIAATIIAIGTSLPELTVTIVAFRKKEHGLAMGNIIGSNLFNISLIGGVGALISGMSTSLSLVITVFFLVASLVLYLLAKGLLKPNKTLGITMLALYFLYIILEYTKLSSPL